MLYKIVFHSYISLLALLFFFNACTAPAQTVSISKYGVAVIDKIPVYQQSIRNDSAKKMVELRKMMPGIVYDLRYAGTNNFMHRTMYVPLAHSTFLRLPAAQALARVQKELNSKGYGLKIFDAYRPYSVTVSFWELVKDERYVANPAKGSGHNRGLAVDLTIIDLKTQRELDMGTGFDNFTDSAHHSFTAFSSTVLQNRQLLKETMIKYGFKMLETEWWHYFWPNDRNYEVLDIPFNQLAIGN
jgi:D-alanyl-D-alanine dipeptidase